MKVNKVLLVMLCTMFTLTACASEEEIQQKNEIQSTETIEYLEDKYGMEFEVIDSDSSSYKIDNEQEWLDNWYK